MKIKILIVMITALILLPGCMAKDAGRLQIDVGYHPDGTVSSAHIITTKNYGDISATLHKDPSTGEIEVSVTAKNVDASSVVAEVAKSNVAMAQAVSDLAKAGIGVAAKVIK